jgi:hypothetical protein
MPEGLQMYPVKHSRDPVHTFLSSTANPRPELTLLTHLDILLRGLVIVRLCNSEPLNMWRMGHS